MDSILALPATVIQILHGYLRKLWVRVAVMGVLSLIALTIASAVERLVPDSFSMGLDAGSIDRLLDLMASAMLVVTTFSLTVMVSVHRNSSSQWTPRAHQLVIEDVITQNTLATFIGAYVYALVAIILRELEVYGTDSTLVLFWLTVGVVVFVVWSLIRWTLHLQTLGSLVHTARRIEAITKARLCERLETPCFGGHPLLGDVPKTALPIEAPQTGYIDEIFPEALQQAAKNHGVTLYLTSRVGEMVFRGEPMAYFAITEPGKKDFDRESVRTRLCKLIHIRDVRTYAQNPGFGLQVLSEIGSKALSSGINDAGTAVDVITRITRILDDYTPPEENECDVTRDCLYVPPLDPEALLRAGFDGVARDGRDLIEVQGALQTVLGLLANHRDAQMRAGATALRERYYEAALQALDDPADLARLERCAKLSHNRAQ